MSKIFEPFGKKPQMPPAIVLDRLRRSIEAGHHVLYHPHVDQAFEVVSVRRTMNPGIPGGVMELTLKTEFTLMMQAGSMQEQLIIIGGPAEKAKQPDRVGLSAVPPPEDSATDDLAEALQGDLTQTGEPPVIGICPACKHEVRAPMLGEPCVECGDGLYQAVDATQG